KRFLIISMIVLVAGGLAALLVHRHFDQTSTGPATEEEFYKAGIKMGNTNAPPPEAPKALDPKKRIRLAICSLGLSDEASNSQISDLIAAELSHEKNIELVERQSLQRVLGEIQMNLSGLVRAKDAVRVGKLWR